MVDDTNQMLQQQVEVYMGVRASLRCVALCLWVV